MLTPTGGSSAPPGDGTSTSGDAGALAADAETAHPGRPLPRLGAETGAVKKTAFKPHHELYGVDEGSKTSRETLEEASAGLAAAAAAAGRGGNAELAKRLRELREELKEATRREDSPSRGASPTSTLRGTPTRRVSLQ